MNPPNPINPINPINPLRPGNPSAPVRSIRRKLIISSVTVIAATVAGLLAAVIWINASLAARQKDAAFQSIRNALIAKGNILATNNSQALEGMVADNAFLSVAGLVAATVREDEDVAYGIFMDDKRQPWVYADSAHPDGALAAPGVLGDSASLWASRLEGLTHRSLASGGGEVLEFAAPVKVDGKTLGVIRYGLATTRMAGALAEASRASRQALARTVAALVLLGGAASLFAYFAARRQAGLITRPIEELQSAANAIARGDYGRPVAVGGDDEIGLLAADFDSMRATVKEYTERLEGMVEEKIREIKDILDNIEQGLFTVGMDGAVNPDYALSTNGILDVEDASRLNIADLFRMDGTRKADWMAWLEMARIRHGALRWEKLVRLCPVRELRIPDGGAGERIVVVGYQKMLDREKGFHKLMVLVQDVTDARRVEHMIKEEKERHDNEVNAILGVVAYPVFIPDFLADLDARLRSLDGAVRRAPSAPEGELAETMAAMSRDLHTLKGTSATYGFEALSRMAREAEQELAALADIRRSGRPSRSGAWAVMAEHIEKLQAGEREAKALVKRLSGTESEAMARIPEQRIRDLRSLSAALLRDGSKDGTGDADPALARLLRACRNIDAVKVEKLAEKYRSMVRRIGERLGKRLDFKAFPESLEVSPALFAALDEPLVHLLRNAADHGIEMEATRLLHGKSGAGNIHLILEAKEGVWEITVTDDGGGIDVAALGDKAVGKGLIRREALEAMGEDAKCELIFLPGLSTRDQSTEISGMGVGMDAVAAWARKAGGGISVASRPGHGTRITLRLPPDFAEPDGRPV